MTKKVKVFFIKYYLPTDEQLIWKESLEAARAFELARTFALCGYRPRVVKVQMKPHEINRRMKPAKQRR